jgi:hypothetical protein
LGHEVARATPVDVERVERTLTQGDVDVSVLVPAKDEAENLPRFLELAASALGSGALRYEVIVLDEPGQHLGVLERCARRIRSCASSTPDAAGLPTLRSSPLARGGAGFYRQTCNSCPKAFPARRTDRAGEADMAKAQAGK